MAFSLGFPDREAGLLRRFWQGRDRGAFWRPNSRVLAAIKPEKIARGPFQSSLALVHTARTQGLRPGVAFSGSLRT